MTSTTIDRTPVLPFEANDRDFRIAAKITAALYEVAAPINYKALGQRIGENHRQLGRALDVVAFWHVALGAPDITVLVVRKETGLPSQGRNAIVSTGIGRTYGAPVIEDPSWIEAETARALAWLSR